MTDCCSYKAAARRNGVFEGPVGDDWFQCPCKLPARRRYRRNWRGKLILQVEATTHHIAPDMEDYSHTRWRDAKLSDLHEDVA